VEIVQHQAGTTLRSKQRGQSGDTSLQDCFNCEAKKFRSLGLQTSYLLLGYRKLSLAERSIPDAMLPAEQSLVENTEERLRPKKKKSSSHKLYP
jgi:hypothetical protein